MARVPRPAVRVLAALAAALLAAPLAGAAPDDPLRPEVTKNGDARRTRPVLRGSDVVVETADGMKLAATWWADAAEGAAGVVLLHEKGGTRSEWEPFVADLRTRGVAVLAIDLRGHGGSASQRGVDLAPLAQEGAASFVSELHADAAAAASWLVREGRCDAKRIALVGVGLGAAVALDTAGRSPKDVAAVVCLSIPRAPAGIDVAGAGAAVSGRTQVLFLGAGERDAAASAQVRAVLRTGRMLDYEAPRPQPEPGARADLDEWGRRPLVRQTIASFVAAKTGSKRDDVVLDGVVERTGGDADPWSRGTAIGRDGAANAWAYRVGERLAFGAVVPLRAQVVDLRVRLPGSRFEGGRWITIHLATGGTRDVFGAIAPTRGGGGRIVPEVRIVRGAQTTTIEGEWMLGGSASGDGEVRVALRVDPVAGEPRWVQGAASLGTGSEEVLGGLKEFLAAADNGAVVPSR